MRRIIATVALAAFLPLATVGCFGSFELTRKVYKFNKEIDPDKWIQEFTFLVISIIPIYGIAGLIDVLFANSVEFWTGENPITSDAGETRTLYGANGEIVRATFQKDGSVDLTVIESSGSTHAITVVQEGETLAARDTDGNLLARVVDVDGRPAVVTP